MTCPHNPHETKGPIGQYHCPVCGEMVLAGEKHIDWDSQDDSPCNEEQEAAGYPKEAME